MGRGRTRSPHRSASGPRPRRRRGRSTGLPSLPFLVAFGAILLVFDPLQRIARLFGPRPQEVVVGGCRSRSSPPFRLCGTRIEVERSPGVRPHTPYLLIANHQSMFDIPIFGALLFTNYPKYVSKRELASWIPSISYNLRRGGNALIDRADREQAVEAIRDARRARAGARRVGGDLSGGHALARRAS